MIYVNNSIRAIEAYTASTYNEGEKYINEAFNTSSYNNRSRYNVLSEASETNIIIKIKDTIVSFFKWLWGVITKAGSVIRNFFAGLVNKIKGIKINKKENNANDRDDTDDATENLVILDFDQAKALINNFVVDYYENENFKNYKSDIDKIILSKDDNSTKIRNLNKLFDNINNSIKLINEVFLSDMLDIKKDYSVDEMIKILKEKYSFYEKDGTLKKKFQKSVIIKVSEEEKEEEFFKEGTLDLINQLNETIDKNAKILTKAIKSLQDLATDITNYINNTINKIEDEKVSAELAKKSKETAETIMKTSNETNKIKNEAATICMKNAAKAKSVLDEIAKSVANAKTGEDIEKVYNDYRNKNRGDNTGKNDEDFASFMEGLDKQQLLKLINSSGFSIEEFVCLSKYNKVNDLSEINDSYKNTAISAFKKIIKLRDSDEDGDSRRYALYRNVSKHEKTKTILKDYYNKIIKDFKNESAKNESSNIFSDIKFI